MRRTRNAKVVTTLGPASSDKETMRRLFAAGVDVFRLNVSHGSAADHRARLAAAFVLGFVGLAYSISVYSCRVFGGKATELHDA